MATEGGPTAASTSPDVHKAPKQKAFPPLENNPEVMSSLAHKLGFSSAIEFVDVYSIDDPDLLSFIARPVLALLLVFPVSAPYEKNRVEEDGDKEEYAGSSPSEEVVWFKQTIRNACGLIGLLHALCNNQDHIVPDSDLDKLLKQALPLKPVERANILVESDALEAAHHSAAAEGDTAALAASAEVDLHFVCFVKSADNNLWELDGRRKGPLNRGKLSADEDALSESALQLGVKSFLKREEAAGGGELRFSLLALVPSMS